MMTAPASDLLSGSGWHSVHSEVSGSKHSTSVIVILQTSVDEGTKYIAIKVMYNTIFPFRTPESPAPLWILRFWNKVLLNLVRKLWRTDKSNTGDQRSPDQGWQGRMMLIAKATSPCWLGILPEPQSGPSGVVNNNKQEKNSKKKSQGGSMKPPRMTRKRGGSDAWDQENQRTGEPVGPWEHTPGIPNIYLVPRSKEALGR